MTSLLRYDAARAALAEAKSFDDVKMIHDKAEAMRVYARLAADVALEQDAAEIRLRAKRRFGEMAAELKADGAMHKGGRPWPVTGTEEEPVKTLVKLADLGISKKFSSQAQKAAKISAQAFEMLVASTRERIAGGRSGAAPLNGARAVAPSREEAIDSLDYFPTAPWATRALMEHVLPRLGVDARALGWVWEPACGEGHMAGALLEYLGHARFGATDIFDYGTLAGTAPGWMGVRDFLTSPPLYREVDWIITNPPFTGREDRALLFAKHALTIARVGVALFVRTQWLVEGGERYDELFRDSPPTLCAFFTERVPLHKGRWEPDGGTMTAYSWAVWRRDAAPRPPFWIPPYCRATLTRADDVERFTAHPVKGISDHDPVTGEVLEKPGEAA